MFGSKRVLCVEDNLDTSELIGVILEPLEVVAARSIAEAEQIAAGDRFDLFILDYQLPDGNGSDALMALHAIQPSTPAIFVTASTWITHEDAAVVGAVGLIEKGSIEFVDELKRTVDLVLSADSEPASRHPRLITES